MSKQCLNCESVVTEKFAKVYGNNQDEVYRCINCVNDMKGGRRILRIGGAAQKDLSTIKTTTT